MHIQTKRNNTNDYITTIWFTGHQRQGEEGEGKKKEEEEKTLWVRGYLESNRGNFNEMADRYGVQEQGTNENG
jgi:hypothetical protein